MLKSFHWNAKLHPDIDFGVSCQPPFPSTPPYPHPGSSMHRSMKYHISFFGPCSKCLYSAWSLTVYEYTTAIEIFRGKISDVSGGKGRLTRTPLTAASGNPPLLFIRVALGQWLRRLLLGRRGGMDISF